MIINVNNYKNIIFDLGGVLINIDYNLTAKAFEGMGLQNFNELLSQASQSHLFDTYEKGLISSAAFRNEVKTFFEPPVNDTAIDKAWNTMLLDFPVERLQLLQKVKSKHRTFLLSNTNDIHIQKINLDLKMQFGIDNLNNHFEKVYLSYEVGMRKPDAEIFEHVLTENNLIPEQTLFIDDSMQHIKSAKKLGIHTYWLDVKKESVITLFE
jgi:FMN phosphatase YigB (HAD superfamily)